MYLFILLLVDIWVVSSFLLLEIEILFRVLVLVGTCPEALIPP